MKINRSQSIIKEFQQFILNNSLFEKNDHLLVAISGGVDSIVLCNLLLMLDYNIGIAHCNFQLRGKESDADEQFVKQLAAKHKIPYYAQKFDTLSYTKINKISIQMAARELRYSWFEEIRARYNYDIIAVAHHQDDEVETFLINLIRGTGMAGLHGIKVKSGNIVRPLLFADRKKIEEFALNNKIKYREDSSNSSVKYMRNRIRLRLIPMLKELNPQIETIIKEDIHKIKQMEEVLLELVEEKRQDIISIEEELVRLEIKKLLTLGNLSFFLYEFIHPYGFSGDIIEKISKSLIKTESKRFYSSSHNLYKERESLIIAPIKENEPEQTYIISENCKELKKLHLKFKKEKIDDGFQVPKKNTIGMFDLDKLTFPLLIRKWKTADFFYPYGMKGKKKLSDYFTDLKLSLIEKEKVWLLCNKNDIIWIIGHRTDNLYKVTSKTKKVFIAELFSK